MDLNNIPIHPILFIFTFYFTILRLISHLNIFSMKFNSIHESLRFRSNVFWTLIMWGMWWYQIWFWFSYFKII